MAWEVLSSQSRISSHTPWLSLNKNGRITFNEALYEALGRPEYVQVLLDRESNRLGVIKATETSNAYPVKKAKTQQTWGISAFGPLKAIGKAPAKAYRRQAEDLGEGVWGVSLDGMEVLRTGGD